MTPSLATATFDLPMALRRTAKHDNSTTLPAWCRAASGTGTMYKSVVMPNVTCAVAAAAVRSPKRRTFLVMALLTEGSRPMIGIDRTVKNVVVAYGSARPVSSSLTRTRWSNCAVTGFSNMLRHHRSPLDFAYRLSRSSSVGGTIRPPIVGNSL